MGRFLILAQTSTEAGCSSPKLIRLRFTSVFALLPSSLSYAAASRRDKSGFGFNLNCLVEGSEGALIRNKLRILRITPESFRSSPATSPPTGAIP